MTRVIDIAVPDIGDFQDVQVVEVLVKNGDPISEEHGLIVVESDKATMEIPSPIAGSIVAVLVKAGDKVSRGSVIAKAELVVPDASTVAVQSKTNGPAMSDPSVDAFDLVVIGGGPGGYSAAYRAADLGLRVAMIERFRALGGVCLNVGCIPSKALLHLAAIKEEAERIADKGIRFGSLELDVDALRGFKDRTVKKLTDGLNQMARARNVRVINGSAKFASSNRLAIELDTGAFQPVDFKQCIIATGSSANKLSVFPDDDRIVTSTGALQLRTVPKRMLVVGAGIIGLEMATVYSALGTQIDLVERMPKILSDVDPEAVRIWQSRNAHRFQHIDLDARVESAVADVEGVSVEIGGAKRERRSYDLVLQSAGRSPNSAGLGLETVGVKCDANGFVAVDKQMRTNVRHIFAIGDVAGNPMLAHKAVHEGHVAAEAAAGLKSYFDAKIVPNVAYTDPEVAWVGIMEHEAASLGRSVKSAKFPWSASGRAVASGASYGMTKLLIDPETHRIVGGVIVGPHAGDMIGEICLAIEMGADAIDVGKTIHPHPTLGETIGLAAEVYEGVCTDVLPSTKKTSERAGSSK
jgi:dihydrolipoamide dehydrogenase